jgi:hypothetical protein
MIRRSPTSQAGTGRREIKHFISASETEIARMTTASAAPTIPDVPPGSEFFSVQFIHRRNFQITLERRWCYTRLGGSAHDRHCASLAPLMTVLQLPTAYFIPKSVTKDRLVRVDDSCGVVIHPAILPLLRFLPTTVQVELMLIFLLFNVVRGISTGAWLLLADSARSSECPGCLSPIRSASYAMWRMLLAISTVVLWSGGRPWQFSCSLPSAVWPNVELTARFQILRSANKPGPRVSRFRGWKSSNIPLHQVADFNVVYNWVVGGLVAFVIAPSRRESGIQVDKRCQSGCIGWSV